jgi:hypothetical protein
MYNATFATLAATVGHVPAAGITMVLAVAAAAVLATLASRVL